MSGLTEGEALRSEFVANGLDSLHSWRCEHPDRYGPCGCVDEFVRDFLASDWLAQREAAAVKAALLSAADELPMDCYDPRHVQTWLRDRANRSEGGRA